MNAKRIKVGKVFTDGEYEYVCCNLNERRKENIDIIKYLHYNRKLEKEHLLDLGIARWNFYFRFADTFEFMLQRIKA